MDTTNFWDAFVQVSGPDRAPLLGVFLILTTLLIIVIAVTVSRTVYRIHKNRLEDSLKRDLVERGLDVDEIERIVRASPGIGAPHDDR